MFEQQSRKALPGGGELVEGFVGWIGVCRVNKVWETVNVGDVQNNNGHPS